MIPKYEEDFYGRSMAMAGLLKERRMTELDYDNLIEEIESMGGSVVDQLMNRLTVVMANLLKWQHQPSRRCRSWQLLFKEQRIKIKRLIQSSPSLKIKMDEVFSTAYEYALYQAERETELSPKTFPKDCSYTFDQCLDDEFYPD
jgi:hypothetical protein